MKKIMVAGGKYTDKNGQEKTKWIQVGKIVVAKGKKKILLDGHISLASLQNEEGVVWCEVFEQEDRSQAPAQNPKEVIESEVNPEVAEVVGSADNENEEDIF